MQTTSYRLRLSEGASLVVWFVTERTRVLSYAIVLLAYEAGDWHTVRVYDNAHGEHEMHRYTARGGKQPAEPVIRGGDAGDAMRAARDEVMGGYERMVEGWRR